MNGVRPDKLLGRCQQERRPVMQLDTDTVEKSFDAALGARKPGVITLFRDTAPEPGTQVAAWLPAGQG